MEDQGIIRLYFNRDQEAIRQTDRKYGRQCRRTARNILAIPEDAEECVNDTYLRAWEAIPPARPGAFRIWLGQITRNLSLDRWKSLRAEKRGGGELPLVLEELGECVPAVPSAAQAVERVGMPEAQIILSQAAAYVACAPKSNSACGAVFAAMEEVGRSGNLPIPAHLQDAHYKGAAKLGRGVRIVTGKKKGRIELEYYGLDDLNDLLEALALLRTTRKGPES